MNLSFLKYFILTIFITLACTLFAGAQSTIVKGTITDAVTKEPLPFVIVVFRGTQIGTTTDEEGNFILKTDKNFNQVQISYLGYKTAIKNITPGK